MTPDRLALLDDPQVRPFLPLLYVAWVDGDLSAAQRGAIVQQLEQQPWLRPAARHAIERWLAPDHPPSPQELERVRVTLRDAAGTMAPEARRSLVDLGQSLVDDDGLRAKSVAAAHEIAELLGVAGVESAAQGISPLESEPPPQVTLDIAALQAILDGDRVTIRQRVRGILADSRHRAYGLPPETYRPLVLGWLRELADAGLGALAYPGKTTDSPSLRDFMIAFETLALGDLSLLVKFGVQFGLFGGSIFFLGTERHHALLAKVASLETLGCFAMSESGHGSNVADLETVARYDHATRELVITTPRESARKDWIGGAAHDATLATVFAQLEVDGERHGVHAVLVPIRDASGATVPGVRAGDCGLKMGLNGVDNGRLWFNGVRVPVANLLDRFAQIDANGKYQSAIASPSRRFFTMLGTLVGGRVCVGSAGVSVAKSALAIAVRYSTYRRQFGPSGGREISLLEYPTHQRRLLPPLATSYVLHFAFERLRRNFVEVQAEKDPDTRELEAQAAGLKALATWHATHTVQQCREACGGQGYLAVNRLSDLKADSDVFSTFEGDNTVLIQLVAKSILSGFGKQLGGGVGAMLRMVGKLAWTAASEKNPITTRATDAAHLRSSEFLLAALQHREEVLTRTAALRMRKRLAKKDASAHEALLEVQEHMVAAATAHVERLAFAWFTEAVKLLDESESRTWLEKLGQLHALSRLEQQAGWFLEDGYFEASKARAVRKQVEALCREIAPAARSLVDAFGIPDACLAAPIAFFDPATPPA